MSGERGRQQLEDLLTIVAVLLAALIGAIVTLALQIPTPNSVSDWLTIVTAIAAVGQIVIAGIALQSLRHAQASADASTKSLSLMQETSQRQLRAYVAVTSFEFERLEAGKPLVVRVNYANTGQTPAHEAHVVASVGLHDADAEVPLPPEVETPASVAHLGAQRQITQTTRSITKLSREELAGLEAGRLKVVCCGRVHYRDVFGQGQYTEFHGTLSQANAHGLTEFRRSAKGNFGT